MGCVSGDVPRWAGQIPWSGSLRPLSPGSRAGGQPLRQGGNLCTQNPVSAPPRATPNQAADPVRSASRRRPESVFLRGEETSSLPLGVVPLCWGGEPAALHPVSAESSSFCLPPLRFQRCLVPLVVDCERHGSGFSASGLGPAFLGAAKPLTGHSLRGVFQQSAAVPPFLFFWTLSLLLTGILVECGRERRACPLFETLVAGSPIEMKILAGMRALGADVTVMQRQSDGL